MGHNLSFLLRYYKQTNDSHSLDMVTSTLDNMAAGGIYDHIGGGFHRYSTDKYWFLPHFEKMLYDQALLVIAYLEAYQITGKEYYARIVKETLNYIIRDMTHERGGFYSAEDADSEGEEGKFYRWTYQEIIEILGKTEGEFFCDYYSITPEGNFEGFSLLNIEEQDSDFVKRKKISIEELVIKLTLSKDTLLKKRAKRIRPHLDDKIMTDWNGLMISAFAFAARVFDDKSYLNHAIKSAEFIIQNLQNKDGRLLKYWRKGPSKKLGLVDDYAFFINSLIDLYEASFQSKWLDYAIHLSDDFISYFWDKEKGGFYFSPKDMDELFINPKELYDGAIPSGNSMGAYMLTRLGHILQDEKYYLLANKLFFAFSKQLSGFPEAFPMLLIAYDYHIFDKNEVVISGNPESEIVSKFFKQLNSSFKPRTIVIVNHSNNGINLIEKLIPFIKEQKMVNGRPTFYICKNYTCNLPTNDLNEALKFVNR